jgi:hypothetical protein
MMKIHLIFDNDGIVMIPCDREKVRRLFPGPGRGHHEVQVSAHRVL